MLSVNGLIAFLVGWIVGTPDVRRQGDVPDLGEFVLDWPAKTDRSFTQCATPDNFRSYFSGELDRCARLKAASWFNQRGPEKWFELPEEEYFNLTARRSMAEEAGREYFGVIDDYAVAGSQVFRKIAEVTVVEGSCLAMDNQHA